MPAWRQTWLSQSRLQMHLTSQNVSTRFQIRSKSDLSSAWSVTCNGPSVFVIELPIFVCFITPLSIQLHCCCLHFAIQVESLYRVRIGKRTASASVLWPHRTQACNLQWLRDTRIALPTLQTRLRVTWLDLTLTNVEELTQFWLNHASIHFPETADTSHYCRPTVYEPV